MGVGDPRDVVRVRPWRREPPREARDAEVEAPPEEVDGAALPEEPGAELLQQPVRVPEEPEPLPDRRLVVGSVRAVLVEGDRIGDLPRLEVDLHVDPERREEIHELPVEVRDRARRERHGAPSPVVGLDREPVIHEVEGDLEAPRLEGDRRRRETARSDVERDLPPVVHEGGELEPHLPHDLGPHVEGVVGLLPVRDGQARPVGAVPRAHAASLAPSITTWST